MKTVSKLLRFHTAAALTICCVHLFPLRSSAIPAYPYPVEVTQPDGSTLTITGHGDEFSNWITTADGYTVLRDAHGAYVYARQSPDGMLAPTDICATNSLMRTSPDELRFLASTPKGLRPSSTDAAKKRMALSAPQKIAKPKWDYDKFRGLVILVNYTDVKFHHPTPQQFWDEIINKEGYDGYMTSGLLAEKIEYTGSVHDYFKDNSMGKFAPGFDVIGPVDVNYASTFVGQTTSAQTLMRAACEAADPLVDFSDYDANADGVVDMVYFIFAGAGSNYSGNNTRLLWPHASNLTGATFDGINLGRYACSTELYGSENGTLYDGIGTICHEFSHVIGLCDEYDVDYENGGGQSTHPGEWSIMASGGYLNYGRTPTGYSIFERYQSYFAEPKLITADGTHTLEPVSLSNTGFRINSPIEKEYFLIENRQPVKWDKCLPGHGMLVWRVDSTDASKWENNRLNTNPARNYYELIRATPKVQASGSIADSDGDPFPGSGNITEIGGETVPSLKSYTGMGATIALSEITESADGLISFRSAAEKFTDAIEDFETMQTTDDDCFDVQGRICKWTLTDGATIVEADAENELTGSRGLQMKRRSYATTSTIDREIDQLMFDIYNPNSSPSTIRVEYSIDGGTTWTRLSNTGGSENVIVPGKSKSAAAFAPHLETQAALRLYYYSGASGSTAKPVYVDNIIIRSPNKYSGITSAISAPEAHSLSISTCPGGIAATTATDAEITIYTPSGAVVSRTRTLASTPTVMQLPAKGIYIITDSYTTIKFIY